VEYAVNVCPEETIQPGHLPKTLLTMAQASSPSVPHKEVADQKNDAAMVNNPEMTTTFSFPEPVGWGEVEKGIILKSLTKTGGNRSRAAEMLGWSRSKLWRKIKHHGLE